MVAVFFYSIFFRDYEIKRFQDAVVTEAKEVVISEAGNSILANPAAYRSIVKNLRFDGSSLTCTVDAGGSDLDFKASSISVSPASEESFAFPTAGLDKAWIITDLR